MLFGKDRWMHHMTTIPTGIDGGWSKKLKHIASHNTTDIPYFIPAVKFSVISTSFNSLASGKCVSNLIHIKDTGLILGLRPANERRSSFVTTSLIGWAQAWNQPWDRYLQRFLWNYPQVNDTRPHWWLVNIGSGNGLLPSWDIAQRSVMDRRKDGADR